MKQTVRAVEKITMSAQLLIEISWDYPTKSIDMFTNGGRWSWDDVEGMNTFALLWRMLELDVDQSDKSGTLLSDSLGNKWPQYNSIN